MASFLKAFAEGYAAWGLGGGQPVYPGFGPAERTGAFTTIIPTGGLPLRYPTQLVKRFTAQINTWGPAPTFGVPYELACTAWDVLHEASRLALDGYLIERCKALQEPFANGEQLGLVCVTFNVLLYVRKASGGQSGLWTLTDLLDLTPASPGSADPYFTVNADGDIVTTGYIPR